MAALLVPAAQKLTRESSYLSEPKMLKQFGLLWDDAQNPHCPADNTLMVFNSTKEASTKHGQHDYLRCLTCKQVVPIFDSYLGPVTLHKAKNMIKTRMRSGLVSD